MNWVLASSCITIAFLTMLWLMDSLSALPSIFRESRQYEYIEFMRSQRIAAVSLSSNFFPSSTESKDGKRRRRSGARGACWDQAPLEQTSTGGDFLVGILIKQPQKDIKTRSHKFTKKRHRITAEKLITERIWNWPQRNTQLTTETWNYHRETQNDKRQKQINHKEMQNDHKKTQN